MVLVPVQCPHCRTLGQVDNIYAGRMVQCIGCGRQFPVPAAGAPMAGPRAMAQPQPRKTPIGAIIAIVVGCGVVGLVVFAAILFPVFARARERARMAARPSYSPSPSWQIDGSGPPPAATEGGTRMANCALRVDYVEYGESNDGSAEAVVAITFTNTGNSPMRIGPSCFRLQDGHRELVPVRGDPSGGGSTPLVDTTVTPGGNLHASLTFVTRTEFTSLVLRFAEPVSGDSASLTVMSSPPARR